MANETNFCRICWNTKGWKSPSGRMGKSPSGCFKGQFGFGFEEWLFREEFRIGVFQYGFLQQFNTRRRKNAGKEFDLFLFTINSTTGEWFWVRKLKSVIVLTGEERSKLEDLYHKNDWLNLMRSEARGFMSNPTLLPVAEEQGGYLIPNVKFKHDQIPLSTNIKIVPFTEADRTFKYHRYGLLKLPQGFVEPVGM